MYCSEGKYRWWLFRNGNGSTVFFLVLSIKYRTLYTQERVLPLRYNQPYPCPHEDRICDHPLSASQVQYLQACTTLPNSTDLYIHLFWNKVFCSTGLNLTGLVIKIGLNSQSSVSTTACITHIWLPLWSSGFKMFLVTSLGNIPAFSTHVQCSKGLGEYLTISPWTLRFLSTCDLLTLVQIREQHGMTQAIPCPLDLLTISTSAVNTCYPFVQGLPRRGKGLHCLQAGRTRRVPAEQPLAGG